MAIPEKLSEALLHHPLLYARLMRLKGNWNQEKYVYLHLINRGDTIIEGGANIGYYTRIFAHLTGAKGSVHAFEPTGPTFKQLSTLSKQHLSKGTLQLNALGLSSQAGSAHIYFPGEDSGQASLKQHHTGSWEDEPTIQSHQVTLTTLDNYVANNNITRINFIKIDIEGAELEALHGAPISLEKHLPLLHLEVSTSWLKDYGHSPQDLVEYLNSLGYDSFFAYDNHIKKPMDLRDLIEQNKTISGNVICAVYEKHKPRLTKLNWQRQTL